MNSLKTIFSRIGTLPKAQEALAAVGVSVRNSAGKMKDVSVVINELGQKWQGLTKEQKTNTLVNVSGVYQQNRLAALMNNYQMAVDSTTTSMKSQGSAMREQEKFNESLKGRLNQLSTAWVDLSNTVGQNVLYDSIVVITKAMERLADSGSNVVSAIGLLPPLFGTAYTAVFLLNSGFRTLTIGMGTAVGSAIATTVATRSLTVGVTALRASVSALGITWKSFMASTGIGLLFVGVGFAIEKLTNVMSENIQMQEEMEASNKKNIDALTTNSETVNDLISQYNSLSEAKENDKSWDAEKESEYLRIQQQLADMYPALISHIDSTGQAHIKSKSAIEEEIKATEELIRLKKEETKVKAEDIFKENIKNNEKLADDIDGNKSYIKSLEKKLASGSAIYNKAEIKEEIAGLRVETQMLEMEISASTQEMVGSVLSVADAFSTVKIDSGVTNQISDFLYKLDFSNLNESELKSFATNLGKIMSDIQKSINNGDSSGYDKAIIKLNKLASNTKGFKDDAKSFTTSYEKFTNSIKNGNVAIVEGEDATEAMTESIDGSSEAIQKQVDKLKDLSSAHEKIVGISEAQVKAVSDSITVIEFLGDVSERTEQQESSLASSIELLTILYPQLTSLLNGTLKQREQAISIINSENKANQALLKAYELAANGKMTAEGRVTMTQLEETNKRINNINAEIRALDTLQQNYNAIINEMSGKNNKNVYSDTDLLRQEKFSQNASNRVTLKLAQLAKLSGSQSTYATSLSNTNKAIEENDKATSKSNKSKKDSNKTTKDSIYITDKYKESLEELNLEIEKQVKLQSTLPEHSDDYKKSLQTQIKLEKDKLALIEKQAKSLQSQISSGKIKQTGSVSVDKSENAKTTYSKDNGAFGGRISSNYGWRTLGGKKEFHRGIDLASSRGTAVYSNVSGKVIKAGNASSTNNGKAMDGTYGNMVVVQDDSGMKHIFAHLDKTIAKFGDTITAGTKLGTVGSTGNSTGNHLHYEQNTANGKLVNPTTTVNSIRKSGIATTSGGSSTSVVDNSQQAIDQAKSDLNNLYGEMLEQEEKITNLEKRVIDTSLASYEFKKSNYDKFLENSDNRLNKLTKSSQAYRDELVRSSNALNAKKEINKAEIEQLKKFINSGTLSSKVVEEYTDRLHELGKINSEIDFSLKDLDNSKLESYSELIDEITSNYEKQRGEKDSIIGYDTIALEELDKSSNTYLKSLEKINSTMKDKQNINLHELNSLNQLITNGKLYGKALDTAKNRVNELNKEIKQLQLDIQEGNFNVIVNIKTQSDAKVDDMQFELDRADAIRKMFEEGSVDYANYTQKMIEMSKQMANQHLKTRDELVEELKRQDITIERRKEILELLEDEHMAYLNATLAIKDYTKQKEDAVESQRKEIADNVINALKEAYQEYRDERMKMLDEEIERENKKHEQIMKQLNDEMNLFRKNVEEKLRLIDRQESERDYNMEIDDMEKERNNIQSQINLLSLDNSNEAKSKRKKLQEQLDKIDKDIAEKRHDRDIELQKQGLNDLLESKENEINGKIEVQDKEHDAVLKGIDRQKEYWEKYYSDLLNDERTFAKIREDIMNGHFDKVQVELQQHITDLTATMPQLADTLDGTMGAVGMAIRQNIIDNLSEAIKMITDFNSMQISSGGFNDGLGSSGGIGSIVGDAGISTGSGGKTPQGKLVSDADLKVIMAKYMTDVLANQYNDVRANNIREKAHILAREGRAQGSVIEASSHYNTELAKLSKEDRIRLSDIASSNYTVFESTEMQNTIKRWANSLKSLKSRASALSGGMTSWSGNGIDGKGGKEMIVHPNELINSPLDTKNLLDMSNVMQRAMQFFTPVLKAMSIPKSLINNNSNSNGGNVYEITFTGDIKNTTKDGAKQFATDIMNEIRTKKG